MITVLMCTYNGERFVREQLDSILTQTVPPDRIVISDDGSTDETWSILEHYASLHPSVVIRRHDTEQQPRVDVQAIADALPPMPPTARNFLDMMVAERDDYLMLSDQDDVWHPDKIAITLAKMRSMETNYGTGTPCLTHTDLLVVDEELTGAGSSFREVMSADWTRTTLRDQIVQNTATGCTIMYNRALAELLTEVPRYAVMHDWWLPLVACAFGRMEPVFDATISYRQHGGNVIGAKDMRTLRYKLHRAMGLSDVRHAVRITYLQAAELLRIYGPQLSAAQAAMLATYIDIPNKGKLTRIATVRRERFWKSGLTRNIAYLIVL